MRGHSVSSSSSSSSNSLPDFLSGRVPIQGSSKGEFTTCTGEFFFPCRLGSHDLTENYGGPPPPPPPQMSGLPTLGSTSKRESQASESVVYPADGNAVDERKRAADGSDGGRNRIVSYHFTDGHHVQDVGRKMDGRGIKDAGRGSMKSNSLNIKQQDYLRTDTQLSTLPSRTTFAQTLRRSVPMMHHENSGSQRTLLSDSHMNPNDRNSSSSSSSLLIPNEILTASSTSTRCQSGSSSLVGGSRSGTSFSPRHRDTSRLGFSGGGERLSHRYLGRSRTHSIISALEHVERDEDLTYEQLLMLEATLLFGGLRLRDQHSDLRLDVDNMSYEELLALEDRIGNVSTGLTAEAVAEKLKRSCYSSLDVVGAQFSQEYDTKCSICQEEYEDGDKLGKIECGHSYHALCIQQWLVQKNQCPICKATAFAQ
ncbi:unnamed protein product [Sphagnum tenellum]